MVCIVRVLGSVVCVFRVVSVVCGLVSRRHQSRRPSSRLCRLVAVALCLCFLCVMRFLVHTSAWNNKRGLVAYFVVWGVFRFFGMVIVCSVRVCVVFIGESRSCVVVLMSSFHVALLSSCHVLCWWLSSYRGRHVGVV